MTLAKTAASVLSSALLLVSSLTLCALSSEPAFAGEVEEGKSIAFNRKKGNCLACHAIEGGALPGNIGPPLVNMKQRYPNKAKLRSQIWDATENNPNSIMPPFGKHQILSSDEVNKVVEFVHSL